jgi:DNA mismatch endonuclease (patch repair protein)
VSRHELFEDVTPARRRLMSRVRAANSEPERIVRRLLHSLGYRFRLHRRDLPGTPDIVLASRRKVIFVHGCFWHRHPGCVRTTNPKTRREYWQAKFAANTARDARNIRELEVGGWKPLVVWECETREPKRLSDRLTSFLEE